MLGIDAGNPELLRRWAADGTMPNLARLMARGISGTTRSLDGFFIGSTWPSFYTGVSPARHGFNYLVQLRPGTYELYRPATEQFVKAEPFWAALSRAGRRVAILDVPLCRLDPGVNGIHVIEWGGHDPSFGFGTSPAELRDEITVRRNRTVSHVCDADRRSPEDYRVFVEDLLHAVEAREALTRRFLRQGGWDFFIQVFAESHCGGHQLWHLQDTGHPAHDPALAVSLGAPLRKIYQAIDRAIGGILEDAGDALILVASLHGMEHWYGAQFLLPELLFRLGAASPAKRAPPTPRGGLGPMARAGMGWARRQLPDGLRRRLGALRRQLSPPRFQPAPLGDLGVDPLSSRCFPIPNGLASGGVRLNLVGREPHGLLQPGAEADAFCAELSEQLLEIVDERTGGRLVERVLRVREVFSGEHLDDLPDLLVEWNATAATGSTLVGNGAGAVVRAHSPRIGVVEGVNDYCRTGEHRLEGLVVAAGPGLRPGRFSRTVSVLDFAPSIRALLGVPMPECEGRVVAELLG